VAGQHGAPNLQRVHEREEIVAKSRLLTRARSFRGQESRRAVAPEVRGDHPAAGCDQLWRDLVVRVHVVGEAVEEEHGRTAHRTDRLIGHVEDAGLPVLEHESILHACRVRWTLAEASWQTLPRSRPGPIVIRPETGAL